MTNQKSKEANVPNLRFPGFEGVWEVKRLGEIATFFSGGTPLTSKREYFNGNIPFIKSGEIKSERTEQFISELGLKNSSAKMVNEGDILYALYGATSGEVGISKLMGAINQAILCIRSTQNHYFIYSYLSHKKEVIIKQTGSGREGLNFESIKNIKLSIPILEEQQKIASFLSIVNDRIITQNKILIHYQSLIQKIRKDLLKKRLRFKRYDDTKFADWTDVKLNNIAERIYLKNSENNQNVLTISAQMGLISQLDFFNKSVSSKNIMSYYSLKQDDFAYNKSYSSGYPMGAIKRLKRYECGVVSTLYICFRFKEGTNVDFMEHYFESGIQNPELEKVTQEGARNHGLLNIGIADFFNITINLPEVIEQEKIAKTLNVINEKIETEKKILKQLEKQKQYLLSNLFV
jgi:type I restriction enzyme S subunit